MNNADFWASVHTIIAEGFTSEGLLKLDSYAEQFISGRLVYQRFSPQEQHGCATGGATNVIASLLAGAEAGTDSENQGTLSDYQRECQLGAEGGEAVVYDHGSTLIKSIGLDYFIQPIFALDRISLHNTYFPETRLTVLGFGRDKRGEFKIIAEQPYIEGQPVSDEEIADYMRQMGFELKNPRNWTYATPDIYLSDMHDENVIRSKKSDTLFVVDCDIRINTPELRQGGTRTISTEVRYIG